jgi:hypothetical protein
MQAIVQEQQELMAAAAANQQAARLAKFMKLPELPVTQRPAKRRLSQPPFKLLLETPHDVDLRLRGTLIFVGPELFCVLDCIQHENDYLLAVEDGKSKRWRVPYSHPLVDLRSPEPQYISYEGIPAYLSRRPARAQQQGISYSNSVLKNAGNARYYRPENISAVIKGITAENVQMDQRILDLMTRVRVFSTIRMSPNIALYLDPKDNLNAEFKGRWLGFVNENTITVDELDARRPWIKSAVQQIGCELRRET